MIMTKPRTQTCATMGRATAPSMTDQKAVRSDLCFLTAFAWTSMIARSDLPRTLDLMAQELGRSKSTGRHRLQSASRLIRKHATPEASIAISVKPTTVEAEALMAFLLFSAQRQRERIHRTTRPPSNKQVLRVGSGIAPRARQMSCPALGSMHRHAMGGSRRVQHTSTTASLIINAFWTGHGNLFAQARMTIAGVVMLSHHNLNGAWSRRDFLATKRSTATPLAGRRARTA